jgi:hypothetical protein
LISIQKPRIGPSISLYLFSVLFNYITEESFLNVLFILLFEENLSLKLTEFIKNNPEKPKGFFFDWEEQRDFNDKNFYNLITQNFSEQYIQSIVYMNNSPIPEIQKIVKFFDKYNEENFNSSNFQSFSRRNSFSEVLKEQILNKLTSDQLIEMKNFHKIISRSTGFNMGLITEDEKENSFLNVFDKYLKIKEVINLKNKFK